MYCDPHNVAIAQILRGPRYNGSVDTVTALRGRGPKWGVAISAFSPSVANVLQPNIVPGPSISGFLKSLGLYNKVHTQPP